MGASEHKHILRVWRIQKASWSAGACSSFPQAACCREVRGRAAILGGYTQSKLCSRKLEQAPAFQIRRASCIYVHQEEAAFKNHPDRRRLGGLLSLSPVRSRTRAIPSCASHTFRASPSQAAPSLGLFQVLLKQFWVSNQAGKIQTAFMTTTCPDFQAQPRNDQPKIRGGKGKGRSPGDPLPPRGACLIGEWNFRAGPLAILSVQIRLADARGVHRWPGV